MRKQRMNNSVIICTRSVPKCPDTSAPTVPKCLDTSAPVPICLTNSSAMVPKCLGSEVSRVRSVCTPFWVHMLPVCSGSAMLTVSSHPVVSSSSFFFSSPNLGRRKLDVCHTSAHGVVLVRI